MLLYLFIAQRLMGAMHWSCWRKTRTRSMRRCIGKVHLVKATKGRLGGQGIRLSDIISRYTGQKRSTIQYHRGNRLLVRLAKYQNNLVIIQAEAQSRQQDPKKTQSKELDPSSDQAKELDRYVNILGHEKIILTD